MLAIHSFRPLPDIYIDLPKPRNNSSGVEELRRACFIDIDFVLEVPLRKTPEK
jgi:hypothetical protein